MKQDILTDVVSRVMRGRHYYVNIPLVNDKATYTFHGMDFVTFESVPDATATPSELENFVINSFKVIY